MMSSWSLQSIASSEMDHSINHSYYYSSPHRLIHRASSLEARPHKFHHERCIIISTTIEHRP